MSKDITTYPESLDIKSEALKMSKDITTYLECLDIKNFEGIVPRRRSIIGAANGSLPQSEFNANHVAQALHPKVQHLVISAIKEHEGNNKSYILEPAPGTETKSPAYFRAGQYLSVKLRIGHSFITRPYSISSAPSEALKGRYSLTIKRQEDGFASNYIFDNWQEGTVIEASAPKGEFVFEPLRDAQNIIGLAGGSGITPFYSLAQAIADGTEDAALTLLYGSRRHDEILLQKELEALAASCGKIKIVHVLSDDPQAEGYEQGFLTAELIKKYAPAGEFSIFVCGPAEMYSFMDKELVKLELPKRRIRYETFGDYKNPERDKAFPDAAIGKTFRLRVGMRGKRKKVQAKSGESILVALERAGIAVPSICRSGECGYCRSRLVSGSYYIPEGFDHRRMADVKLGYIHPCCTFPTGDLQISVGSDEGEIKRGTMQQRRSLVGLLMTLFMSTVMGIVATLIARSGMPPQALASAPPAVIMVISSVLMSLTVGIIIWLVIPSSKWGSMLAAKTKASPGSFKYTAMNALPISFVNSFVIGIVVSFINVSRSHAQIPAAVAPPLIVMWFGSWIKMFPILLVVAYMLALLVSPLIVKWVKMPQGMPKKRG